MQSHRTLHKEPGVMPLRRRKRAFTAVILVVLSLVMQVTWPVLASAQTRGYFGAPRSKGFLPQGYVAAPFTFIVVADSHFGSGKGNTNSSLALRNILESHNNASFLIHLGDITETGAHDEYEAFRENTSALPFPVLATLGNHESRWQDPQGAVFNRHYGPATYSFDFGAWHFVVLDSTYPEQTLGSIDPSILAWLEEDLSSQPKGRPVAVFSHHPLLYEQQDFQDSDDSFLKILDKYPIAAVFSGHGHSFIHWRAQGRDFCMIGALMDGMYAVVEVEGYRMDISKEVVRPEETGSINVGNEPWVTLSPKPLQIPVNPVSGFSSKVENGNLLGEFTLTEEAQLAFQIDSGFWNDLGRINPGDHRFTVDVSKQARGTHTIRLKAQTPSGPFFSSLEFNKDTEGLFTWETNLGSAVTGDILSTSSGQIILGTREGLVYCLDAGTGDLVWRYDAGAAWGGGVLEGSRLYFGTAKGEFHCVDSNEGGLVWKRTLDEAGFQAAPRVYHPEGETLVYLGSSSGRMYALNPITGITRWCHDVGSAITNTPSAGANHILFGAWNCSFYALDALTGQEMWSRPLGRQVYYSPVVDSLFYGGTVFTATPSDKYSGGSYLYALDAFTGAEKYKGVSWSSFMEPSLPVVGSANQAYTHPFILAPDYGGRITAIYPDTGEIAWHLQGERSLFAGVPALDSVFVTGGSRGVLSIFRDGVKIDVKVRDCFLLADPLVLKTQTGGSVTGYMVIQSDTKGKVTAIAVPDPR